MPDALWLLTVALTIVAIALAVYAAMRGKPVRVTKHVTAQTLSSVLSSSRPSQGTFVLRTRPW